ncbi:cold-shock protein [Paenibacillus marinisediminis]
MYNRKNAVEDIPEVSTAIWSCETDTCKGWMRDNFSFQEEPTCPLCNSPMIKGEKMLPVLVNYSDLKTHQKSE